ncbi:hypothetical protein LTR56_009946 [Elasticomyces elasticus]|nr:hypothetical protein LTR56_009946 [Elasticomyces elasticus]KAK3656206.1 hypothetical protein LTR22_009913 [Elasticomyces elasticus]KAK5756551.1 hypothetical protein LTS12_013386 [Elasticomyces elasticus]
MDHHRRPYAPQAAPPPAPHAPPNAPPYYHHTQTPVPPHPQYPQSHQQQQYAPPPPTTNSLQPPATGPALPPIHQTYGPPGSAPDQRTTLPSLQHPTNPHEPQGHQEHYSYPPQHQHNRSGHATPAPVNRTYSHDSTVQRTPTTPAPSGQYPHIPGPEGVQHQPQPPPPPQHHMEYSSHPVYPPPNGVQHGLPPPPGPPGPPPQQPHHEQYASYAQPSMENHHGQYAPQQQQSPMYPPQTYGPAMTNSQMQMQRKKQMRATQACEQCRQRKQKCDEGNPCSFCKEQDLGCVYRDTPPVKTDKNMEKLLQHMEAHTSGLGGLTAKMEDFDARLRRMEQPGPQLADKARRSLPIAMQEGPVEEAAPLKKSSEHRTAPHKLLLLWSSVAAVLKNAHVNKNDGYVMEAEDRGILRLYTRGEGIDEYDGTHPGAPGSPARSEDGGSDNAIANAPTPPESVWGTGFPQTPSSEPRRSEPYNHWGGLKSDGTLDLDQQTVKELHESYMKHIHVMHPFLDQQRLQSMIDKFVSRYCSNEKQRSRTEYVKEMDDDGRATKRQRSNGAQPSHGRTPERSPGNAVVYLVLALGKICQHTDPLPAVVQDNQQNANQLIRRNLTGPSGSSPMSAPSVAIKPSPISPNSTPATQPTPPADGNVHFHNRSRRSSTEAGSSAGLRNIDVIPGLAYYAKAAEILGDQSDGNDLVHAQMFLLAGLYKGQLARVKESMSWFTMAGRAVRSLLDRYHLYNKRTWSGYGDVKGVLEENRKVIKDKRHNMIVLAAWSCLQLESDILAELPLPSSHIQDLEKLLSMPHKVPEDESYTGLEDHDDVLLFYTAQLWLRRKLNEVHRQMYGSEYVGKPLQEIREMLLGHDSLLDLWREGLPPALRWVDDAPPPSDILNARLRAKYWGARYVVNRPFLDYALHVMPHVKNGKTVREVAKDANNDPRDEADIQLFEAIAGMTNLDIWNACERCIAAALKSTVAFDGVPSRLVVTNIHGTAHAQFGNMLVVSAIYNNNAMKGLVIASNDTERLSRFKSQLARTIRFLRRLSPISPTCGVDCSILEDIQKSLFGVPADQKHVYLNEVTFDGSFGSSST